MVGISEHVKERLYVGAVMASSVTGGVAATLTFMAGVVIALVTLFQAPDFCWLCWAVLISVAAVLTATFVLGLVGALLGLIGGGIGALLQLGSRRIWCGVPLGGLIGAGLGWLFWFGLDALMLWAFAGEETWRVEAHAWAAAPLVQWFAFLSWIAVGLLGGGFGAFHVVLFQEVFDKKVSRSPKARPDAQ